MDFFHKKYKCEQDGERFNTYEDLIDHSRTIHHHTILKCNKCGKQFLHEKDRLHHVREEHEKEMDARVHKSEHHHKTATRSPQEEVNSRMRNFGDNF
ncbi:MAG: hypothetical protein M3162_06735 [Thermoproteota archaeon]|nr:hypothetical protein [Thermoproteota archaeon]